MIYILIVLVYIAAVVSLLARLVHVSLPRKAEMWSSRTLLETLRECEPNSPADPTA